MDKTTFNVALELKLKNKVSVIRNKYNVTRGTIYYALSYFDNTYKNNNHIRNQIVLGSILGDGFIQNRQGVYIYRECHSLQEEEYLKWKFLMFDDWTKGHIIYNKNYNNSSSNAKEFATSTKFSEIFKGYYHKTIEQVIEELDIYGLLIFALDDGWYNPHSKRGNIIISSGNLTINQLNLIRDKFKLYNIETTLIGKRLDICIDSKYNSVLLSYLMVLFDNLIDIDVIIKKFQNIINDYKNLLS